MKTGLGIYCYMLLVSVANISSAFVSPWGKSMAKEGPPEQFDSTNDFTLKKRTQSRFQDEAIFKAARFSANKMKKIQGIVELGLKESVDKYIHQETINSIDVVRFLLNLRQELKDWRYLGDYDTVRKHILQLEAANQHFR